MAVMTQQGQTCHVINIAVPNYSAEERISVKNIRTQQEVLPGALASVPRGLAHNLRSIVADTSVDLVKK